MMKYNALTILLLLITLNLSAQTKNERESRVAFEDFPEHAQSTINTIINSVRRVRHYKETDGEHTSYESKFKFKGLWYSAEYDPSGTLEDIEVEVRERQVNDTVSSKINTYLKAKYAKYDILKIQEQYRFKPPETQNAFLNRILNSRKSISSRFEIVVAVKTKKDWLIKEMTFDETGQFISERTLQTDSYEYIMY